MKQSADFLDILDSVLDGLIRSQNDLLKAANQKRAAILSTDHDQIEKSLEDEMTALSRAKAYDGKRLSIQKAMAGALKVESVNPGLGDLLARLEPSQRVTDLQEKRDILFKLAVQVREKNEVNQQLIYESLKSTQVILQIITGFQPDDECYSKHGKQKGRHQRHLLDRQA